MKLLKYGYILATATMMVGSLSAQKQDSWLKKNNAFITAGAQTEAFMDNNGHIMATGKLGFGMWLKPWMGLKLEGIAGNTRLMENSRGQIFGVQLSYMANLVNGGDRVNSLGLNGIASLGYARHKFGSILKKYSFMDVLYANIGMQGVYYINPNWNVYLEPSLILQPKYYDVKNKEEIMPGFMLSAGVNFCFADKHAKSKEITISYEEFEKLNNEINMMRREIEELKKNAITDKNNEVTITPEMETSALSINFDTMGAVLSEGEIDKLKAVATWIKDHNSSVTVVPFADYKAESKVTDEVKNRRFEAIVNVLNSKFGVNKALIKKGNAEKMGYVNKYAQEALIIFNAQ